jgi:hypothetical protein
MAGIGLQNLSIEPLGIVEAPSLVVLKGCGERGFQFPGWEPLRHGAALLLLGAPLFAVHLPVSAGESWLPYLPCNGARTGPVVSLAYIEGTICPAIAARIAHVFDLRSVKMPAAGSQTDGEA